MGDGVAFEQPGHGFVLIPGFPDRDRVAQQRLGRGRRDPAQWILRAGRGEVSINRCRRHGQQLVTHLVGVAALARHQLPVGFEEHQLHPLVVARYFPLIPPANAHTRCHTVIACAEYFNARSLHFRVLTRRGFNVACSWRRALSLGQPVFAHTSLSSLLLVPFSAAAYCRANFMVVSCLARFDSPLPMK